MSLEGAIAAHRFGLGARPGEIDRASGNPKAWLLGQINGPAPQPRPLDGQSFANAGKLVSEEDNYKIQKFMNKGNKKKGEKRDPSVPKMGDGNVRKRTYVEEMSARFALGMRHASSPKVKGATSSPA